MCRDCLGHGVVQHNRSFPEERNTLKGPKYDYAGKLIKEPDLPFTIHTSELFDPKMKTFKQNISLVVDPSVGMVIKVYTRDQEPTDIRHPDIDLRGKFVLPGLVDAHTHIFLHSYTERQSVEQKRDESFAERIVRAVNHCRRALLAGYTTYRDLGSESMQDADTNIRDAINRGITVGPRLYVATKVLASTSSYDVRTENTIGGTKVPEVYDRCDGVEGVRAAVRRRIGAGADIIKFYADYRKRVLRFPPAQQHPYIGSVKFPPKVPNPEIILYTQEEMNSLCDEARRSQCAVAAHCGSKEGAIMAAKAGALTIEHAYWADDECLITMKERNCIFVPTLAVCEKLFQGNMGTMLARVKRAYDLGVDMAAGGDTGTFSHGRNAHEMGLMVGAGVPVVEVLRAATYNGWRSCGGDLIGRRFGFIEEGVAADLIAVKDDPRLSFETMYDIDFVMKDATVYKKNGIPIMEVMLD
ncbi:uncharacterized protein PRCAT00005129001 [Priceomyces carsonii]|uniref:uncharacterized protein n=1 Tax=Priceomyces carsonii TaxID=28549 RepID=UPI002ED7E497|nr:unnamed protein product [Priceomyces carsonii]